MSSKKSVKTTVQSAKTSTKAAAKPDVEENLEEEPLIKKPAKKPVDKSVKTTGKPTKKPVSETLEKDIQVIPISDFDASRIIYSEPVKVDIPGGGGARRVNINYKYQDGKFGPLNVQPGRRYCYGVQPNNIDKEGKVVIDEHTNQPKPLTGYKAALVMTSKDPEPEVEAQEKEVLDFFDNLVSEFRRYAVENKAALNKGGKSDEAVADQVTEILFRKKDEETQQVVEGYTPKLYPSLLYYHKKQNMETVFYDEKDEQTNPLDLVGTGAFYMTPTIKIDSLWVSKVAINPQVKLYDATVEPIARMPRKRLAPGSVPRGDAEDAESAEEKVVESDGEEEDAEVASEHDD